MRLSARRALNKKLNIIKWIIFGIIVVILLFQIIIIFLIPKETDTRNRLPLMIYEVTSDSMFPKLQTGDGIIDVRTPFNELEVGDLITFVEAGDIITHEIVFVEDEEVIYTSGINPVMQDAPVTEEEYVGRVIIKLPGLSTFLDLTEGPLRKAIWILLLIFILFVPEAIFNFTENRRKERINEDE